MKKMMISLAVAALLLTACGKATDVSQLEQDIQILQKQVDALSARLDALEENSGLMDWNLTAIPNADGNGASVTLTASPLAYHEGQTAQFSVRYGGQEVASILCNWDGSVYSGTVDLEAADGYSYYCVLIAANGSREQMVLNTPENPVYDTLVYMETSLNAYCNIIVDGWEDEGGNLTITSGYAQIQLPRLSNEADGAAFQSTNLVLRLNGNPVESQLLDMPQGEGEGSYELVLSGNTFKMPELQDDYQLELILEVTLSDGQVLTASGGSWYYNAGEMFMVVG